MKAALFSFTSTGMFCYHCPITASLGPHPHHHHHHSHLNPTVGSQHIPGATGSIANHASSVSSATSSALASLPSLYSSGAPCKFVILVVLYCLKVNKFLNQFQTVHTPFRVTYKMMHLFGGNSDEIVQHLQSNSWKS